jgi:hypothetical protein
MLADNERLVLLNRLVSLSTSRARLERPPTHSAAELLEIMRGRVLQKIAIEHLGMRIGDDDALPAAVAGLSFMRLREIKFEQIESFKYVTLLIEYVNSGDKTFPVVHIETFEGREIQGAAQERGASTAHVVARLPADGDFDDGAYRCAIEVQHPITRSQIEHFLAYQLRRHCDEQEWLFPVNAKKKRRDGKVVTTEHRYRAKFRLLADVGRKLNVAGGSGRNLSHMVFSKRATRQAIGKQVDVINEEIVADVELRVHAKQGPEDPAERLNWAARVRKHYEERGYDCRLYFRNAGGQALSGAVDQAIESAADLLMCPRETIYLTSSPKRWHATIHAEVVEKLRDILDQDELWERGK